MDEVVRSLQPDLRSSDPEIGYQSFNKLRNQLSGLRGKLLEEVCPAATNTNTSEDVTLATRITQWAVRYLQLRKPPLEDILCSGKRMNKKQKDAARQAISTMFERLQEAVSA